MHQEIYDRFENLIKDVTQRNEMDLPLREIDIMKIHFSISSLCVVKSKYPLNEIIIKYYGLPREINEKPEDPKTLKEIGIIYKFSQSRAQQLKDKGLTFLRRGERATPFIFMFRDEMERIIKRLQKNLKNTKGGLT